MRNLFVEKTAYKNIFGMQEISCCGMQKFLHIRFVFEEKNRTQNIYAGAENVKYDITLESFGGPALDSMQFLLLQHSNMFYAWLPGGKFMQE